MSSLSKIRKQIVSIKKTSKITQAMKLVSTIKMQHQKNCFFDITKFMDSLYNLLHDLAIRSKYENIFSNETSSNKKLYILITSSLGLCGSFNINVCKHLLGVLNNDDDIYVIGTQGLSYLRNHGYIKQIKSTFVFDSLNLDYLDLFYINQSAIDKFKNGVYSEIHIVYTKYVNSLNFVPVDLKVLPIKRSLFSEKYVDESNISVLNNKGKIIELESKRSEIIKSLIPFFFGSLLFSCMVESQLCEHTSRRNAMEAATDNANELIDKLKSTYNQERQNKITQEITEIIAGASE